MQQSAWPKPYLDPEARGRDLFEQSLMIMMSWLVDMVISRCISGGLGSLPLPVPHRSVQRSGHLPLRLATAYGHLTVPDLVLCFRSTGPFSGPCAGVLSPDRQAGRYMICQHVFVKRNLIDKSI